MGIEPTFDDRMSLDGGNMTTIMENKPTFNDRMSFDEGKMTTIMGNRPNFADSMAWGGDKMTKNVGTIQGLDQNSLTVSYWPAAKGLVTWGTCQNVVTVWLCAERKGQVTPGKDQAEGRSLRTLQLEIHDNDVFNLYTRPISTILALPSIDKRVSS